MKLPRALQYMDRHVAWPANLTGALITYAYFRFVDYRAMESGRHLGAGEILFFVVAFAGIIATGVVIGDVWNRPRSRP